MSRMSVRRGHPLAACVVALAILLLVLLVPVGPARGVAATDQVAIAHDDQPVARPF